MPTTDVYGVVFDVSANTDKFIRDVQRATQNLQLDFDTAPLLRSFAKSQGDLKKMLAATVGKGLDAGLKVSNLMKIDKHLKKSMEEVANQQAKILQMELRAREQGMTDERKAALLLEKTKLVELRKRLREEEGAVGDFIKRMNRTRADFVKGIGEAGQEFGESVGNSISQMMSGNFGGALSGLGKGMASKGAAMQKGAKAAEVAGKGGGMMKMMGQIGGALAKMGPYIAAIGGVVAGLAALVAVAIKADSAMKELNRTILTSGMAGADLANEYGRLEGSLDEIRSTFSGSFSFNRVWGTTAKDHLEILGAFSDAGETFREMKEGVKSAGDEMERLKDYTVAALTYSKLLGMSTQEVSAQMASYMEELGLTLEGVQQRFANIAAVARESGFSTKRFFNMLLQATSGMSMYNVRVEEAVGLLNQLGKILGEKMSGDFLQTLTKGFKDEGTQERIKKTMTTGVGYSVSVLQKDAARSAEEFSRKLGELGEDQQAAVNAALATVGAEGLTGEALARKLSTLSTRQRGALGARVGAADAGTGRMLRDLMRSSEAYRGGLGGATAARSSAGAGASLLLRLQEARGVLGRGLHEISEADLPSMLAAEGITGQQGEAMMQLQAVGREYQGREDIIQEAKSRMGAAGTPEEKRQIAEAFNESFGKEWKVSLDEQGQLFAENGWLIEDGFENLILATGEIEDEAAVNEDIELAREIAGATTDMSKILEQGVEYFLSKIYDSVQYIASVMGMGGLSEEEKHARGVASAGIQEEINATREQLMAQSRAASGARRRALGLSGDARSEAEAEAKAAEDAVELLETRLQMQEKQLRAVQRFDDGGGWFGSDRSEDYIRERAAGTSEAFAIAEGSLSPEQKAIADEAYQRAYDQQQQIYDDTDGHLGGADKGRREGSRAYRAAVLELAGMGGGTPAPLEEVLGTQFIEEGRREDERSKREGREDDARVSSQTSDLIEGFQKIQEDEQRRALASALSAGGGGMVGTSELDLWVDMLRQGQIHSDLRGRLTPEVQAALLGTGALGTGAAAQMGNDVLMHIGATGRVKFAQRLHPGDETTTLSSRSGQAVSRASGGQGGVTIVQHNYTDMESIKKGWRALQAAKALG